MKKVPAGFLADTGPEPSIVRVLPDGRDLHPEPLQERWNIWEVGVEMPSWGAPITPGVISVLTRINTSEPWASSDKLLYPLDHLACWPQALAWAPNPVFITVLQGGD